MLPTANNFISQFTTRSPPQTTPSTSSRFEDILSKLLGKEDNFSSIKNREKSLNLKQPKKLCYPSNSK